VIWWKLADGDTFFYCPFFQEQEKCTDFLQHSQVAIIPVSKNHQRTVKYLLCDSKFRLAYVMYCIAHDYYATVLATFPSEKAPGNHCTGSWDMDGRVIWNWIWEVGWEGMDGTRLPHDNYHPCRMGTFGVPLWEWSWKIWFPNIAGNFLPRWGPISLTGRECWPTSNAWKIMYQRSQIKIWEASVVKVNGSHGMLWLRGIISTGICIVTKESQILAPSTSNDYKIVVWCRKWFMYSFLFCLQLDYFANFANTNGGTARANRLWMGRCLLLQVPILALERKLYVN